VYKNEIAINIVMGIKISELPPISIPFDGNELLPIVQSGETKSAELSSIFYYLSSASSPGSDLRELSGVWQDSYTIVAANSGKWTTSLFGQSEWLNQERIIYYGGEPSTDISELFGTSGVSWSKWVVNLGHEIITGINYDATESVVINPFEIKQIYYDGLSYYTLSAYRLGNADSWDSVYTTTNANSANWDGVYTTTNANSAIWSDTFTTTNANSANWSDTFTTTNANSANWDSVYTTTNANSANWDYAFTAIDILSAKPDFDITEITDYFEVNQIGFNSIVSDSANLGTALINGNLTVYGDITAKGTTTFSNTTFTTTSALSVIYTGDGAALYVSSNGTGDIASFYDTDTGVEVLHVGGSNGVTPRVSVNTTFTVNGEISGNNVIYGLDGTSTNWNNVYTTTNTNSANWSNVYTTTNTNSANWSNVYTSVSPNSANWSNVFTTTNTNSANWSNVFTTTNTNSANWSNVFTSVSPNSANWNNVRTTTNTNSASWSNTFTTVSANSAKWLTADFLAANNVELLSATIQKNLLVYGTISAKGGIQFTQSTFATTSALSVVYVGEGTAMYIGSNGTGDIASFYDIDTGVEMLHVGGSNGTFPNVGVKTSTPGVALTVNGEISGNNVIYGLGGTSTNWNNVYTTTNTNSANWSKVFTSVSPNSANWSNVYTTTNTNSANWSNVYTTTNTNSGRWSNVYTSVSPNSANWSNVFTTTNTNSANWSNVFTTTNTNSARWVLFDGNTVTSTLSVGTKSDNSLSFITNNKPRATIANDGVMTITSASETAPTVNINGVTRITRNAAALQLVGTDHNYVEWYPDGIANGRKAYFGFPSTPANYFEIKNEITDGTGHILLSPGTNGNVGVNTSNPLSRFHIQGGIRTSTSTYEYATITNTAANGTEIQSYCSANDAKPLTIQATTSSANHQTATKGSPNIIFKTYNTERMVISGNGNIGIGGIAPTAPLTIAANNAGPLRNGLRVVNNGTTSSDNAFISVHTNTNAGGDPIISWEVQTVAAWCAGIDNSDSDKFKIASNSTDLNASTRLTIDHSNGNVGINTSTPGSILDVNGEARLKYSTQLSDSSKRVTTAGVLTINLQDGDHFRVPLSANVSTLTLQNPPATGRYRTIVLDLSVNGARSVAWPASFRWPGGVAPTLTVTPGRIDTFLITTIDGGSRWFAYTMGQNR
jgi:hypothetical protein